MRAGSRGRRAPVHSWRCEEALLTPAGRASLHVHRRSEPKIRELGDAGGGQEHVGRLDVAVGEAVRVQVRQAPHLTEARCDASEAVPWPRSSAPNSLAVCASSCSPSVAGRGSSPPSCASPPRRPPSPRRRRLGAAPPARLAASATARERGDSGSSTCRKVPRRVVLGSWGGRGRPLLTPWARRCGGREEEGGSLAEGRASRRPTGRASSLPPGGPTGCVGFSGATVN